LSSGEGGGRVFGGDQVEERGSRFYAKKKEKVLGGRKIRLIILKRKIRTCSEKRRKNPGKFVY